MAEKEQLEDDAKEPVGHLLEHRLPWLTLGLLGGMATAVIISKYESILSRDLRLAFFGDPLVEAVRHGLRDIFRKLLGEVRVAAGGVGGGVDLP